MSVTNAVFQLFADKMGGRTVSTFIADFGMVFYDPGIGELRIGDGVTPGGLPIYVESLGINYDGGSATSIFGSGDFNYDGGSAATQYNSFLNGGNA